MFIRTPELLQGLACVPYRGESGFIDKALQEWFITACHPLSVEEMMAGGELSQLILSFLNGYTDITPAASTAQNKTQQPKPIDYQRTLVPESIPKPAPYPSSTKGR